MSITPIRVGDGFIYNAFLRDIFFKLVLITAGTGLDLPGVQYSLRRLTKEDEVWIELDGGTQAYLNKVSRTNVSLEKILSNILLLSRQRQVVIQSLFMAIHGEGPAIEEIEQYAQRLLELKNAGARISLVQIHSGNRLVVDPHFGYLPLKFLSQIAQTVRQTTGLKVEVFKG